MAEVLPVAAGMRPELGQSGRWPVVQYRAAVGQQAAFQPLIVLNACFPIQRTGAPDPKR